MLLFSFLDKYLLFLLEYGYIFPSNVIGFLYVTPSEKFRGEIWGELTARSHNYILVYINRANLTIHVVYKDIISLKTSTTTAVQ